MSRIFLDILVVLVAAKLAAEVAERIGIPAVVGEILAGIVIGPSVLGFIATGEGSSAEVLLTLGEIGVILLLLEVGMQMDLRELGAVGRAALTVAVIGVVVPMAGGVGVGHLLGLTSNEALFVGSALAATSVGITARVFGDLRALATIEARTVLGAAVADDVIGLIILTVVVRITSGEGSFSFGSLIGIIVVALGFLFLATLIGMLTVPRLFGQIERLSRSSGTLVALALAFTLGIAELAILAKLAPIVGAFVAGLVLGRSSVSTRVQKELTSVGHLFIPVFFLQIGINVDLEQFVKPSVIGLASAMIAVGVIGKVLAGFGATGTPADRLLIGLGMIPRGEVGLIFASIGLREGILTGDVYAAVLAMVLVTTLVTPPLLSARVRRTQRALALSPDTPTPRPEGGWLKVETPVRGRATVSLAAQPPRSEALVIALDASLMVDAADASVALTTYLVEATGGAEATRWDADSTAALMSVIRGGSVRAWRFLESTAVLDRALPELGEAMTRRRRDPSLLDPSGVHHGVLLERCRRLVAGTAHDFVDDERATTEARHLLYPDRLLLGAYLVDMFGQHSPNAAEARAVLDRLTIDEADRTAVAALVADRELMRAAALRADGLHEDSVLRIAAHLGSPEQARALYVLSVAVDELETWESSLLTELHRLVLASLDGPTFSGADALTLLDRTRDRALALVGDSSLLRDRVAAAPLAYLLSEEPVAVARHVHLLEPFPLRASFRVAVTAESDSVWRVEIGARDQLGLLALVTGVLERAQLDVVDAVLATWGDGAALQAFRVRTGVIGVAPDAQALLVALAQAQHQPLVAAAVSDAVVSFDDLGSPWHTIAEVRATDRRGLLHALAVAFAAAGADVHSARITTNDSMALDRFDLTDRTGRKLDDETKASIRLALSNGVEARSLGRRLPWRTNTVGTIRK